MFFLSNIRFLVRFSKMKRRSSSHPGQQPNDVTVRRVKSIVFFVSWFATRWDESSQFLLAATVTEDLKSVVNLLFFLPLDSFIFSFDFIRWNRLIFPLKEVSHFMAFERCSFLLLIGYLRVSDCHSIMCWEFRMLLLVVWQNIAKNVWEKKF